MVPAGTPAPVAAVLEGLARRTQEYYDRFVSIICTETVDQQDVRFNLMPTRANGQPAFGLYMRTRAGHFEPFHLQVLDLADLDHLDTIASVVAAG